MHHANTSPEETLAAIRAAGVEGSAHQADLSTVEDCQRVVDEAAAALGGLDILVNNAGVTVERAFEATDAAAFDELVAINLRGYFFVAQQALTHFPEAAGRSSTSRRSTPTGRCPDTRPTLRPRGPSTPGREP